MHGGKSLKGKESGTFKHGLYSKYASQSIQDILDDFQKSEIDFTDPIEEIKLLQAVIASAEMLKKEHQDEDSLQAITRAISALILSKQRAQSLMIERNRLLPINEVEQFVQWIDTILNKHLPPDQAVQINNEILSFRMED